MLSKRVARQQDNMVLPGLGLSDVQQRAFRLSLTVLIACFVGYGVILPGEGKVTRQSGALQGPTRLLCTLRLASLTQHHMPGQGVSNSWRCRVDLAFALGKFVGTCSEHVAKTPAMVSQIG